MDERPFLTKRHVQVLEMLAEGKTPTDVAQAIRVRRSQVPQIINQACRRAGIRKDPRFRYYWQHRDAIRAYLNYFPDRPTPLDTDVKAPWRREEWVARHKAADPTADPMF